ncbi:dicarboxylate/amino acid:cation symporter, partial [Salmonella enterica subsp. enterica serovar Weltevreden]|uniref:cation:dicarboxylate symporter family transporter n=1 Tax=Salmonella enterica TaxID=28901 RepID=UPI001F31B57F
LGEAVTPYAQLVGIVPLNIVEALAKGDMLALIFVAILTGVGTILAGEAGRPFAALLQSLSAVLLRIVALVMEATPFGVFALIANAVASGGAAVFVH